MKFDTIRNKMTEKLPAFILVLCLLQPLMDVLSFWMGELQMSNLLTLALRMGLLGLTVLLGFCTSRRKKAYWIMAGVLAALGAGHMASCAVMGYQNLFTDLTNFVRVAQLPVTALCMITMMQENPRCYNALRWGLLWDLVIILAVEVLAGITGTEPHTYMDGAGILGWFQNTNSQSAVISMLPPVAVVLVMQKKGMKSVSFWVLMLASAAAMFLMGPRLALLGLGMMGAGLAMSVMIIDWKQWKRAVAFLLVAVALVALLDYTPAVSHQKTYETVQAQRQDKINNAVKAEKESIQKEGLSKEEKERLWKEWIKALEPIYETFAGDFVELFGMEKTMKIYNYSYNVKDLTALRFKKIQYSRLLMGEAPAIAHLFGIELSRFTVNGEIYDVENDYHGIYFLYGAAGLAAMLVFLGYFIWLIIQALVKNWKRYFTLEAAAWGIALIMCLVHAYFTAAVLRRPNASFYLSAVLAAVYYLVRIKVYPSDSKEGKE